MDLINDITTLIPQRPPFVMIDRLCRYDKKMSGTVFLVKKDNIFVENERFGEPGLLENIAQTAAAQAGYAAGLENIPVKVGYIGAVKNFEVHSLPCVGDELITEITVLHQIFDVSIIKGTITCRGELVAACEMKIFISQLK